MEFFSLGTSFADMILSKEWKRKLAKQEERGYKEDFKN